MKFKKENILPTIAIGLTICFLGAGGITLMLNNDKINEINAETENIQNQINALQNEVDAPSEEKDVEVAEIKLQSATTAGNKIAELQNKYNNAYSLKGEEQVDMMSDMRTQMSEYLSEGYSDQWLMLNTDACDYEWKFNTTYSFSEETVPVLWTCHATEKNDNDYYDLLAYTTATYSVENNKFSSIKVNITSAGDNAINKSFEMYANGELDNPANNNDSENNTDATDNPDENNEENKTTTTTQSNEERRQGIYDSVNNILDDYKKSTSTATSVSDNKTTETTITKVSESEVEVE